MTTVEMGLGSWAIGGQWTAGGEPAGWGETSDRESRAAIAAAVEAGICLFDTAQAYGAGHSETLLGDVIGNNPDVKVITKVGLAIDPDGRRVLGAETDPNKIEVSLDASRKRLRRDKIDLVLLHLNSLSIDAARQIFDRLENLRARGWLAAYGWSTDYPDRAAAFADRPGFVAVEHARNVFFAAKALRPVIDRQGLTPLVRSPLAMGLLGGKYAAGHRFGPDDLRSRTMDWMAYFKDGTVSPQHLDRLERIRDYLSKGHRSLAQGALGWIWADDPRAVPLPGFRTVDQVTDLAAALSHGPLPADVFQAIEAVIDRPPEGAPKDR